MLGSKKGIRHVSHEVISTCIAQIRPDGTVMVRDFSRIAYRGLDRLESSRVLGLDEVACIFAARPWKGRDYDQFVKVSI